MVFIAQYCEEFPQIEKYFKKCHKELEDYFGFKWGKNKPNLFLIPDRKSMDELFGYKTPNWVVGSAKTESIFLLNPNNFEKYSCHNYSKEYYESLIKHEYAHCFSAILSKCNYKPIWLIEGIAIHLSGQNRFKKKPEKFSNFLQYETATKEVYDQAGFAADLLEKKFGKDKLIMLIKGIANIGNESEFNDLFKKIYKNHPELNFFNSLLKILNKKI